MQRTLYADGVLVDNTLLNRTEFTKATEILRGRVDWTSRGVFSGGVISVAAITNTRVDIAAFSGFVPNGEYVECTGNLAEVQLSDSTSGVVNYVCAFYTEYQDMVQPHETDGKVYPTRAQKSYRVRAYTAAEYAALAYTNSTLTVDTRDRALILGKVTGAGSSNPLTGSSIEKPTVYNNILYALPRVLSTITGVEITGVSPLTPTGAGTLGFTYAAGVYRLQWTPFGGGAGTQVDVSSDGTYLIYDSGALEYLEILVTASQLPTDAVLVETLVIVNMYAQEVPRLTAEDTLHRNMQGSGVPVPTNPHALSLDDLSGESLSLLDEHQDVMHCNGIWKGSSPYALASAITPTAPADKLTITALTGSDLYYVNGKKLSSLDPLEITFDFTTQTSHLYEIYATQAGALVHNLKASYPISRNVSGTWIVDMSDDYPSGSYNLECTMASVGVAPTLSWDGGVEVSVWSSRVVRLFAQDGIKWIDLWVNRSAGSTDEHLPTAGASYVDSIGVSASLSSATNLLISTVVHWYDAVSFVRRIGYPPYAGGRSIMDKRTYGTLCLSNVNDKALQALSYNPIEEYHVSGVVLGTDLPAKGDAESQNFALTNISGRAVDIVGGAAYCRGKRVECPGVTGLTLNASNISIIYMDTAGDLQVLDSFTYASNAVSYVLGNGTKRPDVDAMYPSGAAGGVGVPERGVPLWEVHTDATSVTNVYDIMRNINRASGVYTVASRGGVNAAFDSLYSAFLHAEAEVLQRRADDVKVEIVGDTSINRTIYQQDYVSVVGVADHTVTIDFADTLGIWRLESGCSVRGVSIHVLVANTGVFCLAGDSIFEECEVQATVYKAGVYVFSEALAGDGCGRFQDCFFGNVSAIFDPSYTTASRGPIRFERNAVQPATVNTDVTSKGVVAFRSGYSWVKDNYMNSINSVGNQSPVVYVIPEAMATISGNFLGVGISSVTTGPEVVGIYTDVGSNPNPGVTIKGNRVFSSGATNIWGVGVHLGAAQGTVSSNLIDDLGVGIRASGSSTNLSIVDNTFSKCNYRSVEINNNDSSGITNLRILGNKFSGALRNSSLAGRDNHLRAIYLNHEAGGGNVINLSVNENQFSDYTDSQGDVYGIQAVETSTFAGHIINMQVSSNSIEGLEAASSDDVYGVKLTLGSGVPTLRREVSVINNKLKLLSKATSGAAGDVVGIMLSGSSVLGFSNTHVDNNSITLLGDNTDDQGTALRVTNTRVGCTLSNNTLTGLEYALYSAANVGLLISGNVIVSNGYGIYDVSGDLATPIMMQGNVVEVTSYIHKGGVASSAGIWSDSPNVKLSDNSVTLRPNPATGTFGVYACMFVKLTGYKLTVENCYMGPVTDTTAVCTAVCSLLDIRVADTAAQSIVNLFNNHFDNRFVGSVSRLSALRVNRAATSMSGSMVVSILANVFSASLFDVATVWGSSTGSPLEVYVDLNAAGGGAHDVIWIGNTVKGGSAVHGSAKSFLNASEQRTNGSNYIWRYDNGSADWW